MTLTWGSLLTTLLAGRSLTREESGWVMREVMAGDATPAQTAGFLMALRAKGETPEEVVGLAQVMLDVAPAVPVDRRVVDTCGTGGDRAHTVNISTMAALVVAGAGIPVAKHGNRAASSACGTADVLEELGVVIDLGPEQVGRCLAEAGIAFCFAPVFHAGMRHAGVARKELGVPTVFNILGPLTNPTRPLAQAVGVSDARLAPVVADVLAARGADALVFRGDDGLDELTTSGPSHVWVAQGGTVTETSLDPLSLGIARSGAEDLRGGDAAVNAAVVHAVLAGQRSPVRDAVVLNAAAAIAAYRAEQGPLEDRLRSALVEAQASLDSGAAATALTRWVEVSQRLRG